eukprot:3379413-Alexandrium_andersonii.AAC.1
MGPAADDPAAAPPRRGGVGGEVRPAPFLEPRKELGLGPGRGVPDTPEATGDTLVLVSGRPVSYTHLRAHETSAHL